MKLKKYLDAIIAFFKKHPIIKHLLLIIITGIIIVWSALIWLDSWTGHGEIQIVPNVKGLPSDRAVELLTAVGLTPEIADSIHNSEMQPGQVAEQNPRTNARVKPGRTVYLTINAYAPKTVALPELNGISLRQARSVLESLGITHVNVRYIPSEYRDLVLGASYNGRPIKKGMRVPVSAKIVIEAGETYTPTDSIEPTTDSGTSNEVSFN